MISLVAFLGNYGREYERTRHNAAWLFAGALPFAQQLPWQRKFKGEYASVDASWLAAQAERAGMSVPEHAQTAGRRIHFIKPLTYMNLSGESAGEAARFYKIPAKEVLAVHDELELPPGTVSLKWSGGLGGHNGLRSLRAVFGTADFWRLRFGIGRPEHKDIAGYVLSAFSAAEYETLQNTFAPAAELLLSVLLTPPDPYLKIWARRTLSASRPE